MMLERRFWRGAVGATAVLLASTFTGCSDDTKKPKKIKTQEGIARKIDTKNNVVSMSFINKDGREIELSGSVREDTEIMINGRAARLEDVHEGDKVRVSGYREGKGENMKFVATRVEVQRAKDGDWKNTGGPAKLPTSQPSAQDMKDTAARKP